MVVSNVIGVGPGAQLVAIQHRTGVNPSEYTRFQLPHLFLKETRTLVPYHWGAVNAGWSCLANPPYERDPFRVQRVLDGHLFPPLVPKPVDLYTLDDSFNEVALALSNGCERLAAPVNDREMGVWDVSTGKLILRVKSKQRRTYLPGTGHVLVLKKDDTPTLAWFVSTGARVPLRSGQRIEKVFSGAQGLVAIRTGSEDLLFDGRAGRRLRATWLDQKRKVQAVSVDHPWVAVSSPDNRGLAVYDIPTGKRLLWRRFDNAMTHVGFIRSGSRIVVATKHEVQVLQVGSPRHLFRAAYRCEGKLKVVSGRLGEVVQIWSETDTMSRHLITFDARVARQIPLGHVRLAAAAYASGKLDSTALQINPENPGRLVGASKLFIVTREEGAGTSLLIWDRRTGKLLRVNGQGFADGAEHIKFSPDSSKLAISGGHSVAIYHTNTGRIWRTLPTRGTFDFTADSRAMVVAGETIAQWNIATRKVVRKWSDSRCGDVNLSADGRWLRCGQWIFGPQGGKTKIPLLKNPERLFLWDAAIDPSSRYLALSWMEVDFEWAYKRTTFHSPRLTLLELSRPQRLRHLWRGVNWRGMKKKALFPTFQSSGRLSAVMGSRLIRWDTPYRRRRSALHLSNLNPVAVSYRPDGALLVLHLTKNRLSEVWLLEPNQKPRKLLDVPLYDSAIPAAFSPDGTMLATVEQSTSVLVWRLPR